MRAETENVTNIVGMAIALKNNCNVMNNNISHLQKLKQIFLAELKRKNIDFICNGSDLKISGNISLSFKNLEGE